MVATGAQLEFRRYWRAPGVVATNPHMETVDIQPCAFFRVQQMAMAGFHQLLLTVAADVELEVAAPLVWAIIQFARPAAQTVFAREDVRGTENLNETC